MSRLKDFMGYNTRPATGKTWAMLNGALNQPQATVIVADSAQARMLGLPRDKYITIDQIPVKLQALRGPFVIDHYALELLLAEHEREWAGRLEKARQEQQHV